MQDRVKNLFKCRRFIKKRFQNGGASGTLGKDRTVPAHYDIILIDTTVKGRDPGNPYLACQSGKYIRLTINHSRIDGFLHKGMMVQIFDSLIRGDEGNP